MKTNRKTNIELSDGELRKIFNGFCSGDDMERTISDAKKAFLLINRNKEFKK